MISFHRTACIKAGMMVEAMAVAIEFVGCVKRVADVDLRVEVPVGGNPWRIRWSFQYPDLAAMESAGIALMADPTYLALLAKIAEYVISGASTDEVWRSS